MDSPISYDDEFKAFVERLAAGHSPTPDELIGMDDALLERIIQLIRVPDTTPARPAGETQPPPKASRLDQLIIRMRLGYIPDALELSGLTTQDVKTLNHLISMRTIPSPNDLMAVTTEPLAEPPGGWLAKIAPFHEAEKVLIEWLSTVGGVNYGQAVWGGYYVMSNRPGSQGVQLNDRHGFSTFAQCLEFMLAYAADTIRQNASPDAAGSDKP